MRTNHSNVWWRRWTSGWPPGGLVPVQDNKRTGVNEFVDLISSSGTSQRSGSREPGLMVSIEISHDERRSAVPTLIKVDFGGVSHLDMLYFLQQPIGLTSVLIESKLRCDKLRALFLASRKLSRLCNVNESLENLSTSLNWLLIRLGLFLHLLNDLFRLIFISSVLYLPYFLFKHF